MKICQNNKNVKREFRSQPSFIKGGLMKTPRLRAISLFSAIFLIFGVSSCSDIASSKGKGELSISISSRDLAPIFDNKENSSWNNGSVDLKIALFGDYNESKIVSFTQDEIKADKPVDKTITFSEIPVDSLVSARAVVYGTESGSLKISSIGYYGESTKPTLISEEENILDLKMKMIFDENDDSDSEVFGTSKEVSGFFFLEMFSNGNYIIGYAKDFGGTEISELIDSVVDLDSEIFDDISTSVVSFGTYKITKGTSESPEELQITELVYTKPGQADYKFVESKAAKAVPVKEGKFSVNGNGGYTIDFVMDSEIQEEEPEVRSYPIDVSVSGFSAGFSLKESSSNFMLFMVQEGTDEAGIVKEFIEADSNSLSDEIFLKVFDLETSGMDGGLTNLGTWGEDNELEISAGSASVSTTVDASAFQKDKKVYVYATVSLDDGSYYLALPSDFTEFNPEENKISLTLKKWKVPYKMIIFLQKDDASGYEVSETYSKKIALDNLNMADDMIGSAFNEVESKIAGETGEYRYNSSLSGKKLSGQTFSLSYYFDIKAAGGIVSVDSVNISVGDSGGELSGTENEQSSFNLLVKKSSGEEIYDAEWSATLRNANGADTASSEYSGTYIAFDGPNLIVRNLPKGSYFLEVVAYVGSNAYSRTYTLKIN